MIERKLKIGGYEFSVTDRKLVIENSDELTRPLSIIFTPDEANQLSSMLNRIVPAEYGVRTTFRIPVFPKFGMTTKIIDEESGEWNIETNNLSLSGIFADWMPRSHPPLAKKGDYFDVEIAYEEHVASAEAVVTRYSREGIGLAFCHREPSAELSELVMAVQRAWIASKH